VSPARIGVAVWSARSTTDRYAVRGTVIRGPFPLAGGILRTVSKGRVPWKTTGRDAARGDMAGSFGQRRDRAAAEPHVVGSGCDEPSRRYRQDRGVCRRVKSRIVHYRTTYTKARIENLAVRNDCWRSSSYYVCDQFVNGKSAAFIVYTYNASQRLYHLQVISKDGNPPVSGVLTIEGNTWTFPWQYEDKGKVVSFASSTCFQTATRSIFTRAFVRQGPLDRHRGRRRTPRPFALGAQASRISGKASIHARTVRS